MMNNILAERCGDVATHYLTAQTDSDYVQAASEGAYIVSPWSVCSVCALSTMQTDMINAKTIHYQFGLIRFRNGMLGANEFIYGMRAAAHIVENIDYVLRSLGANNAKFPRIPELCAWMRSSYALALVRCSELPHPLFLLWLFLLPCCHIENE